MALLIFHSSCIGYVLSLARMGLFHGTFKLRQENFKEECAYILRLIGALYLVEEGLRAREASADEVLAERQSRSVPILAELHKYLLIKQRNCTPKSGLGKCAFCSSRPKELAIYKQRYIR